MQIRATYYIVALDVVLTFWGGEYSWFQEIGVTIRITLVADSLKHTL